MQELSMNVLDIAQNSVRAQATEIAITVREDEKKDSLEITILDNGSGMTEEQLKRVTDPFYTTRNTRKVGLGIPFFKMAAEMAGGTFSIQSEVGEGTKVHATFVRSHIDRAPLGDMSETISQLMCLNEGTNVIYTYQFNNNVFCESSETFRRELEGVAMNTPEVIQFVRQYLKEHINALQECF